MSTSTSFISQFCSDDDSIIRQLIDDAIASSAISHQTAKLQVEVALPTIVQENAAPVYGSYFVIPHILYNIYLVCQQLSAICLQLRMPVYYILWTCCT